MQHLVQPETHTTTQIHATINIIQASETQKTDKE